jgi:hypothetical protein
MATPICANTGCSNTAHPKDIKSICYGECGCGGICKNKFYWNNCDKCYKEENGEEDDDDCDEESEHICSGCEFDGKENDFMIDECGYMYCYYCVWNGLGKFSKEKAEEGCKYYEKVWCCENYGAEECAVCDDCEGKCKKEISEIFNYYENKYIRKEICDDCGLKFNEDVRIVMLNEVYQPKE